MNPTTIIFVHGLGMWPGLFDAVAPDLPRPQLRWVRPGYEDVPAVGSFAEQAEALVEVCTAHSPAIVVGVGGGATLGLAAAIRQPDAIQGLVTHEPLIGTLEPTLHRRASQEAATLRRLPSSDAVGRFLSSLYGEDTWLQLPDEAREWGVRHWRAIAQEVVQFSSFAPSLNTLGRIGARQITTVGGRSGVERFTVARILTACGARSATIPDAGHLPMVEAASTFAGAIRHLLIDSEAA